MCKKSNGSQLKIGVILSYVEIVAVTIINFSFTPLMLNILGQSEYGLYTTATSTISMLSILSLGFSSSYIKAFARYKKNNENERIKSLNGMYMILFSFIGLISLFCGLFISLNLKVVFANGLTDVELHLAKVLMILLTINLAINFPLSVFNSIIGAYEKFLFQKITHMIKHVLGPMLMIPLLLMGVASVGLVIATLITTLLADILNVVYCYVKLHVRFKFYGWEPGLLKQLFRYTTFIAINMAIDQVNWNIDKIIIGRYWGTTHVAVYNVGHTIHSCYLSLAQNITNVFIPRVHAIANKYDKNIKECAKEFSELFIKIGRVQYIVLGLIMTGVVFYGQQFIYIWAGDGYYNSYIVSLLLMVPSTFTFIQTLGIEIQRSLDKHHFRSIFYLCMALINLVFSIYMCKKWGEVGSALGTCVALFLADDIAMNIYYAKAIKLDVISFWIEIARMSIGLVIPSVFGVISLLFIFTTSIKYLVLQIILYTILYFISMYYLSFNNYEKTLINSMVSKIRMRINH